MENPVKRDGAIESMSAWPPILLLTCLTGQRFLFIVFAAPSNLEPTISKFVELRASEP